MQSVWETQPGKTTNNFFLRSPLSREPAPINPFSPFTSALPQQSYAFAESPSRAHYDRATKEVRFVIKNHAIKSAPSAARAVLPNWKRTLTIMRSPLPAPRFGQIRDHGADWLGSAAARLVACRPKAVVPGNRSDPLLHPFISSKSYFVVDEFNGAHTQPHIFQLSFHLTTAVSQGKTLAKK